VLDDPSGATAPLSEELAQRASRTGTQPSQTRTRARGSREAGTRVERGPPKGTGHRDATSRVRRPRRDWRLSPSRAEPRPAATNGARAGRASSTSTATARRAGRDMALPDSAGPAPTAGFTPVRSARINAQRRRRIAPDPQPPYWAKYESASTRAPQPPLGEVQRT
jgi:hypothetical protein